MTMRKPWLLLATLVVLGCSLALARYGRGQEAKGNEAAGARIEPGAVGVRVLFGLKDAEPASWDGSLAVSGGTLLRLEGWRFRPGDQLTGAASWKASTRRVAAPAVPAAGQTTLPPPGPMTANGVVAVLKSTARTEVRVTTPRGEFVFQ